MSDAPILWVNPMLILVYVMFGGALIAGGYTLYIDWKKAKTDKRKR